MTHFVIIINFLIILTFCQPFLFPRHNYELISYFDFLHYVIIMIYQRKMFIHGGKGLS